MKAILLAGGQGTRLRPLTINTPKPIVPIFNRPFLHYQIDLLKQVSEIDEVILSLNYQPQRIEEIFGDGSAIGIRIRYVVEPQPLGTGGAVKYAAQRLKDTVVVFNGDVLTQIDLAAVIALHRQRQARATIVLTPVDDPAAYGLVETDADGNVQRFLEKPRADEITTNHINAGIYVLEPDTFDRMPIGVPCSIEREYFPSLVERRETFVAHIYPGYWIDIGTPEKYSQVHRDIMDRRYVTTPFAGLAPGASAVARSAHIEEGAILEGPCFVDEDVVVKAGARIGRYSVIGRDTRVDEDAAIDGAILWPECHVSREATVRSAILGRHCHLGRSVTVDGAAVLGDNTRLTDYTRT